MSEDRTPIEELIKRMREELDTSHITIMLEANKLLFKDKAYREKYQHTKEDVMSAKINISKDVIYAWDKLEGGKHYSPKEIGLWLTDYMKPMIDECRTVLQRNT